MKLLKEDEPEGPRAGEYTDTSIQPYTPSSEGKRGGFRRVSDILMSPARFMQRKFKAGGIKGSIFSLITAILGAGTITLPYLAANNGIVVAIILILFGAVISYFSGMLLVECAEKVGSDKYEEFAKYCYGNKMAIFTGWCNMCTLLGFVISYIVFIKTLVPHILEVLFGEENVPDILGKERWKGQLFWATVYTFLVLMPLSIPRTIGALRYNSLFGVICSFYLVMCVVFMFFVDRRLVPDIGANFKNASYFNITYQGLVNAIPFVVFAFMYQPNIPMVYRELHNKNYRRMEKVIVRGSGSVVILYILAASFGYLGLVNSPQLQTLMTKNNILEVEYNNWGFNVAIIGLVFAIFAAAPICVLPSKDAFEELVCPEKGLSKVQNVILTVVMCVL